RLAACFLDSLATLDYPAIGYGIHYEFGLFKQDIVDGKQEERPDNWLRFGNPWKIVRPEHQSVKLYGKVESYFDDMGDWKHRWVDTKEIVGVPWDIPVVGYGAKTINFLRLWESRASEELDLKVFNEGSYVDAVREKAISETISKVLYPNDKTENGKELRLVQQYFFVSCSLQDIIRRYFQSNQGWESFSKKVVVQLNDTHPAIAVAELMRILVDESDVEWDRAWEICQEVFGYTNHTLMPEALERWSVPLFEKVLPRHLQIIYEINRRFLEEVEAHWPGDNLKKKEMSLIEEGNPKMIRMAYLATIGSHSINGVAAIHTQLLKSELFHNFYELYPDRFNNKTNGITPRRWLKASNPLLSKLIDSKIGSHWPTHLDELRKIEKFANDPDFQKEFMAIKRANKERLARRVKPLCNIDLNCDALFDVQIKRLHEYKRQHLNLLHILTLYRQLLHDPDLDIQPRAFIFGAKAAPGYELAKKIIHSINLVGTHINNDKRIKGKLQVAFIPNYCVSLATDIIPAADLSEQISTAGTEASGTGNMKLALNGACTIGTLDGANIEIMEEVGKDNIFIFGKTVEEVQELKRKGYSPEHYYQSNQELRNVLDWMGSDFFSTGNNNPLKSIRSSLLEQGDPFLVLADYASYIETQKEVDKAYKNPQRWAKMAILNTARMGKFSSDRTIQDYAHEIWNLKPVKV
ncbi:MAG: glycogen phosphorylase, partial [Verrucomicrobia bacterium GWC2_42_7]